MQPLPTPHNSLPHFTLLTVTSINSRFAKQTDGRKTPIQQKLKRLHNHFSSWTVRQTHNNKGSNRLPFPCPPPDSPRHGSLDIMNRLFSDFQPSLSSPRPPVANLVDDHPANHDPEAEARESGTPNHAQLSGGETVFTPPVIENATTNGEAHPGGKNRHEPSPQQAFGIGGDPRVSRATHQQVPYGEKEGKKEGIGPAPQMLPSGTAAVK